MIRLQSVGILQKHELGDVFRGEGETMTALLAGNG
jgi:hypothetical protein